MFGAEKKIRFDAALESEVGTKSNIVATKPRKSSARMARCFAIFLQQDNAGNPIVDRGFVSIS